MSAKARDPIQSLKYVFCLGRTNIISDWTQGISDWLQMPDKAQIPLKPPGGLQMVSWNLAAINNNPFEYWLTHPDADYAKLMEDVEQFIEAPGVRDVPVKEVLTPEMYAQLEALMTAQGWEGAAECTAEWEKLSERKIISGFLKDADLGNKRLMSMPDRVSNTIDLAGGSATYRPTVISSFEGAMGSVASWWPLWTSFFFTDKIELPKKGSKLPCELITKIPRDKYPALTEQEEAISVRLQTLCLAIFDAILVHMLSVLSPGGKWLDLKREILEALTKHKESKQAALLNGFYKDCDIIFLQEVRTKTVATDLPAALGAAFIVAGPPTPSKADQNSCVLLSSSTFDAASVTDLTKEAMALLPEGGTKVVDGDLIVCSATLRETGKEFLLASFHGDTDGLATTRAFSGVHALAATRPQATLLFGLDANTYLKPKPGKQAAASDFIADFKAKGYASTFGDEPLAECLTTSNARTFLQPQLQKACKAADKASKGDFNPKDYILFPAAGFTVVEAGKDNTGKGKYVEGMVVPTLDWPSDHGAVFGTILPTASGETTTKV